MARHESPEGARAASDQRRALPGLERRRLLSRAFKGREPPAQAVERRHAPSRIASCGSSAVQRAAQHSPGGTHCIDVDQHEPPGVLRLRRAQQAPHRRREPSPEDLPGPTATRTSCQSTRRESEKRSSESQGCSSSRPDEALWPCCKALRHGLSHQAHQRSPHRSAHSPRAPRSGTEGPPSSASPRALRSTYTSTERPALARDPQRALILGAQQQPTPLGGLRGQRRRWSRSMLNSDSR